jgi:hypothetical protein
MEAFLRSWIARHLPEGTRFDVKVFQGKSDLLGKLEIHLRGYARWLPADWRLFVIVDRDKEDCVKLKCALEDICARAGLGTRRVQPNPWRTATCLAIEELEAWYFGDWEAVISAYPRISRKVPGNARYRAPDNIAGGTWEAFQRVLQRHGYFGGGLEKIRAAREIGAHLAASRNISPSFRNLVRVLDEALL